MFISFFVRRLFSGELLPIWFGFTFFLGVRSKHANTHLHAGGQLALIRRHTRPFPAGSPSKCSSGLRVSGKFRLSLTRSLAMIRSMASSSRPFTPGRSAAASTAWASVSPCSYPLASGSESVRTFPHLPPPPAPFHWTPFRELRASSTLAHSTFYSVCQRTCRLSREEAASRPPREPSRCGIIYHSHLGWDKIMTERVSETIS